MTVLSEEGSDRKSYTKDRNNIKMLIISRNLKLVQWTFGQELDIDKRNFFSEWLPKFEIRTSCDTQISPNLMI